MTIYKFTRLTAPPTLEKQREVLEAFRTLAGQDDELIRQRRAEIAAIRREAEDIRRSIDAIRRQAAGLDKYGYSPEKPRVPKKQTGGGEWTQIAASDNPEEASDMVSAGVLGDEGEVAAMTKLITRDDMESMSPDEYDRRQSEQYEVFEDLEARVDKLLERFGRPDYLPGQPYGDYQVHGDYSEYPQVVVFVENLKLLRPPVVGPLQQLVKVFPGWQIDLMVTLRGHEDWPNMGISIRADEIVDDLRRQYFPPEYQSLAYEHSRRGNVLDRWKV